MDLLEKLGVLICFLPPYSSDLNLTEELFSEVKYSLRANEHLTSEDLETPLLIAFSSVTAKDCQGWITHAGYC